MIAEIDLLQHRACEPALTGLQHRNAARAGVQGHLNRRSAFEVKRSVGADAETGDELDKFARNRTA
jgi:hypothetical protein